MKYSGEVKHEEMQKVTVVLPKDLIRRATAASGVGLTPTIRAGLEKVAANDAYAWLLAKRGKLRLSIDVDRLREDRSDLR